MIKLQYYKHNKKHTIVKQQYDNDHTIILQHEKNNNAIQVQQHHKIKTPRIQY